MLHITTKITFSYKVKRYEGKPKNFIIACSANIFLHIHVKHSYSDHTYKEFTLDVEQTYNAHSEDTPDVCNIYI